MNNLSRTILKTKRAANKISIQKAINDWSSTLTATVPAERFGLEDVDAMMMLIRMERAS